MGFIFIVTKANIKAAFKEHYENFQAFLEENETEKLIDMLLEGDKIERIYKLCIAGEPPLRAVVYDIEKFAQENKLVVNDKLPDYWKQNIGRLIGAIVYIMGYVSNEEVNLQTVPKYFKKASTFKLK